MTRSTQFAIVGAVVALTALIGISWRLGSELVQPVNHPVLKPSDVDAQEIRLPGDGHAIAGWWVDRGAETPVVLLLHGIRADRSSMLGRARILLAHGFSVLMIDLQGHGDTPGDAITLGWRESADVSTALTWVRAHAPNRKVGVIGTSLGGASVLLRPNPAGFDAVVLEAVYPRVSRAIENRIRMRLGPVAPLLTPLLLAQIPLRLHISPSQLEPIRRIDQLHAPLLVVAGSKDQHTTLDESMELFAAARAPKRLWVVTGARHQDFLVVDTPAYVDTVVGFLERYLKPVPEGQAGARTTRLPTQVSGLLLQASATAACMLDSGSCWKVDRESHTGSQGQAEEGRRVRASEVGGREIGRQGPAVNALDR